MSRLIKIIMIIIILMLISTCDEGGNGTGDQNYMPNADQSIWQYSQLEGINTIQQADVVVKINGTETHAIVGQLQVVEIFQDTILTDTLYALIDSTGVIVYTNLINEESIILLQYPLEEGKIWTFVYDSDLYHAEVMGEETVIVPAGTFNNCMRIDYTYYNPYYGDELVATLWFHNGTGIVQGYDVREYYDTLIYQLLDYNIPS